MKFQTGLSSGSGMEKQRGVHTDFFTEECEGLESRLEWGGRNPVTQQAVSRRCRAELQTPGGLQSWPLTPGRLLLELCREVLVETLSAVQHQHLLFAVRLRKDEPGSQQATPLWDPGKQRQGTSFTDFGGDQGAFFFRKSFKVCKVN